MPPVSFVPLSCVCFYLCCLFALILCDIIWLISVPFFIPSTWLTWRKKHKHCVCIFFKRRFAGPGLTWSGRPRSNFRASTSSPWSTVTGEGLLSAESHSDCITALRCILCLEHAQKEEVEARRAGHSVTPAELSLPAHPLTRWWKQDHNPPLEP